MFQERMSSGSTLIVEAATFVEKKQTPDHGGLSVNSDDDFLEITQNLVYLNQVTAAVCEVRCHCVTSSSGLLKRVLSGICFMCRNVT